MRNTTILLIVLASILSFGRSHAGSEPEAIVESVHQFLQAWQTGDLSSFESQLHENIVFAYVGGL